MVVEVSRASGSVAFQAFEKIRPPLARALVASHLIDPQNPENVEAIRFDDNSILWIISFENEEKAKSFMKWMEETVAALKDMLGFTKIEKKNYRGHEVVIAYSQEPGSKETFPSAFWVKGNKFYWYESGHDPDTLDEILWMVLGENKY